MNLKQELREYITQNLIGMEADKGIVFKKLKIRSEPIYRSGPVNVRILPQNV